MKIAIATFADLPNPPVKGGAVEALLDDLCRVNETKKQFDIDLFTIYDDEAYEAAKKYQNTKFIFCRKHKDRKICKKNIVYKLFHKIIPNKTMLEILSQINQNQYDYIIVTSINREMKYIFEKLSSKVIWYLHADPLSVLDTETVKSIVEKAYAVIAVSDFVKEQIRQISFKENLLTVRNVTDLVPIEASKEDEVRREFREKLGISLEDMLYVYVGRITPIKGIYELVQAFINVNALDAKLLIVGSPSNKEEENYLEKIKSIDNQNVYYYGYVEHNDLNKIFCLADCIVVPSTCKEAAALTVLEASICDRPLIATNIGGIPEYVASDTILVEYNDKFIENLMEALESRSKNGFKRKNREEKIDSVEEYYNSFYNSLCQFNKEDRV